MQKKFHDKRDKVYRQHYPWKCIWRLHCSLTVDGRCNAPWAKYATNGAYPRPKMSLLGLGRIWYDTEHCNLLVLGENANTANFFDLAAYSGWLQATVSKTRSPLSWATPLKSPGDIEIDTFAELQNPSPISPVRRMSVVATITPGPLSCPQIIGKVQEKQAA